MSIPGLTFSRITKCQPCSKVAVADALRSIRLPLGSLLCLLALLLVAHRARSRWRARLSLRLQIILAVLLLAVGVGLYPFTGVSIARPAALAPTLTDTGRKSHSAQFA